MSEVTALDVRLTREEKHLPDLGRFVSTLQRLGTALDGIDRALMPQRGERPRWVVQDLRHTGAFFDVTLTARPARSRPMESLLEPVRALVDGVRDLEAEPELPAYYSELTIDRLLELAEPRAGIREVAVAAVNGAREPWAPLSERVVEHGRAAVWGVEESIGSVTGRLDGLKRTRRGLTVHVFDQTARRTVTGTAPLAMADQLRPAWPGRVTVRGRITRNARGQAVKISISDVERLPSDDSGVPSTRDLLGVAPDWTGGLSVEEFLARRNRA
jgi:hypothetical protein